MQADTIVRRSKERRIKNNFRARLYIMPILLATWSDKLSVLIQTRSNLAQ